MKRLLPALLLLLLPGCARSAPAGSAMERIRVAPDGRGFRLVPSGNAFTPWGFNYDRDDSSRLIEEYWDSEWAKVEEDFREMKELGATVVRIHLQFGRFMRGPDAPDERALSRLGRLLELAEETGLYLDLTGLGNYRKKDVPSWYDRAAEKDRWAMQARFWEAVAARCAKSPAVFCYNLMNEPVSPSGAQKEWLSGDLAGFHYVEALSKDPGRRGRVELAREWMSVLIPAIRQHDPGRMITVGMFFIFEVPGGLSLGPNAAELARDLDYLSVHLYPKEGKVAETIRLMQSLAVGKPVVVEEMFPLGCTMDTFRRFLRDSRAHAAGWIGFYWGRSLEEYRRSTDAKDSLMAAWLTLFREGPPRDR